MKVAKLIVLSFRDETLVDAFIGHFVIGKFGIKN
jgi:hypothetical protein